MGACILIGTGVACPCYRFGSMVSRNCAALATTDTPKAHLPLPLLPSSSSLLPLLVPWEGPRQTPCCSLSGSLGVLSRQSLACRTGSHVDGGREGLSSHSSSTSHIAGRKE